MRNALAQSSGQGDIVTRHTYVYYLFQGNDSPDRRLRDPAIERAIARYRTLNLALELSRFRLDYVYMRGSASPAPVQGYSFPETAKTLSGTVYAAERTPSPPSR